MSFKSGKENCTCRLLSALQDSGVGRSLDTPGPTPSHLRGLLGVSFMYEHVWLVRPKKPSFLSRMSRRILAQEEQVFPQNPSLEAVKVFAPPSPGRVGQEWCGSYWPDKAVKQTAKKTLFWLYSPGVQWR